MAEVYVREVVGNPSASIRDVNVLNRQLYERWKPEIMKITEQAVRDVVSRGHSGYIIDKVVYKVVDGKLYATGEGPIAQRARQICIEKYGNPYRRSSGGDDAAQAIGAVGASIAGIILLGLLG